MPIFVFCNRNNEGWARLRSWNIPRALREMAPDNISWVRQFPHNLSLKQRSRVDYLALRQHWFRSLSSAIDVPNCKLAVINLVGRKNLFCKTGDGEMHHHRFTYIHFISQRL